MSHKFNAGDTVQVVSREAVAADVKSQLYFPHYQGLIGTIGKVYDDGAASVNVSPASLPDEIKNRHTAGSDGLRQKWLDGLSDEARNRLSAAEKKFSLRYTILVSTTDLSPASDDLLESAAPARKSLSDIEAAEQRHLEEVRNNKNA